LIIDPQMRTEDTMGGTRSRMCIIVAGTHRSGTSAATRVVNLLGADITHKRAAAAPGINDRGYWESIAIFPIHDELLHGLGSSWDDPFPLAGGWTETSVAQLTKHRIIAEMEEDFADSSLFVVKDPRLVHLLPLWLEIFDELQIEPIVVIPFRNPLEVALSLYERDRIPMAKSNLMYVHGNLEVELASRGRRRVWIHYEQLLADWHGFAETLRTVVGPRLAIPDSETIAEIDNFLTRDLHRNRSSRERLASEPGMAAAIVEIYDRMIEAAEKGDDAALQSSFDRIRGAVAEATRLYKELVIAEREANRKEAAAVLAEREAAAMERRESELAQARAEMSKAAEMLETQSREIVRLEGELASARARTAGAEAASDQQSLEVARLNGELIGSREQATRLEADLAVHQRRLEAVKSSTSWRVTAPIRWIGARIPWAR
jgi:hypothetical protein